MDVAQQWRDMLIEGQVLVQCDSPRFDGFWKWDVSASYCRWCDMRDSTQMLAGDNQTDSDLLLLRARPLWQNQLRLEVREEVRVLWLLYMHVCQDEQYMYHQHTLVWWRQMCLQWDWLGMYSTRKQQPTSHYILMLRTQPRCLNWERTVVTDTCS